MRDLENMGIEILGIQALQSLSDLPVNALAPRSTGLVVEHLPNQRVGELKGLPLAPQQVLAYPFLEQVQQLVLAQATDRAQRLEGEALAEEGRQRQDSPAALAKPMKPGNDGARDLSGKREVSSGSSAHRRSATLLQCVLPDQMMQHLLDEQGIPLCHLTNSGD